MTSLPKLAGQIDARDYASTESNLAMQAVAVANIIEASEAQGVRAELMEPIQELIERRVARTGGMENLSAVVEKMRGYGATSRRAPLTQKGASAARTPSI